LSLRTTEDFHGRTKKVTYAPFSTIRFSILKSIRYTKIVAIGAKIMMLQKIAGTTQVTCADFS